MKRLKKISRFFRSDFLKKHGLSVSATTHPVINDKLHFHVDITSHSVFPKEAVAEIENEIFARLGEKVALYVISRPQKFTSSSRHKRYDDLSRRINKKLQAQSKKDPKKNLKVRQLVSSKSGYTAERFFWGGLYVQCGMVSRPFA